VYLEYTFRRTRPFRFPIFLPPSFDHTGAAPGQFVLVVYDWRFNLCHNQIVQDSTAHGAPVVELLTARRPAEVFAVALGREVRTAL
jgi:hypothetical protein